MNSLCTGGVGQVNFYSCSCQEGFLSRFNNGGSCSIVATTHTTTTSNTTTGVYNSSTSSTANMYALTEILTKISLFTLMAETQARPHHLLPPQLLRLHWLATAHKLRIICHAFRGHAMQLVLVNPTYALVASPRQIWLNVPLHLRRTENACRVCASP